MADRFELGTYTQTDDVTTEVKLSLFNDMDGPILLLLHLNKKYKWEPV